MIAPIAASKTIKSLLCDFFFLPVSNELYVCTHQWPNINNSNFTSTSSSSSYFKFIYGFASFGHNDSFKNVRLFNQRSHIYQNFHREPISQQHFNLLKSSANSSYIRYVSVISPNRWDTNVILFKSTGYYQRSAVSISVTGLNSATQILCETKLLIAKYLALIFLLSWLMVAQIQTQRWSLLGLYVSSAFVFANFNVNARTTFTSFTVDSTIGQASKYFHHNYSGLNILVWTLVLTALLVFFVTNRLSYYCFGCENHRGREYI